MDTQKLYKVTITKDEETGCFVAEVPTLSPCITFGNTIEEALEMVKEAIEGVIESRLENGYSVPDDNETLQRIHTSFETVVPMQLSQKVKNLELAIA